MMDFKYAGRLQDGQRKKGIIHAQSRRHAIEKLRSQGVAQATVNEIKPSILNQDISIGNPVKLQEFVLFIRQFATLLESGVSLVHATEILAEQTDSKPLQKALGQILEELKSGRPFSDAALQHQKIFPPIFINMVRAGEASGSLDETLEQLAVQFEKQHETTQKIKSALTYPAVIGVVAIAVVIFLLTSVVPTFANMLSSLGGELPGITLFVLGISGFVSSYWWVILIAVFSLWGALIWIRKTPDLKYQLDYVLLKMPVFGTMLQKSAIATVTRTLSSLFSSSVPILQSLAIVEQVANNEIISRSLKEAREALESGEKLTTPLAKHWVYPPLVVQMIAIGEETGSLDKMLAKVADFYEKEVEYATDKLKSLIEPLMIVFLAAIVGVIVIAIIVPMFQIYSEI